MLTSAALLLLLRALFPLSPRLDMLHRTGPLLRYSPRAVYERSNIQTQGAWHSSIEEIVRSSGTQDAWQIIAPCGRRNLCSESMLRRLNVRHEPLYAVVFLQEVICEPPKIIIKRPSFDSQLRGQGVDTTELPTRS